MIFGLVESIWYLSQKQPHFWPSTGARWKPLAPLGYSMLSWLYNSHMFCLHIYMFCLPIYRIDSWFQRIAFHCHFCQEVRFLYHLLNYINNNNRQLQIYDDALLILLCTIYLTYNLAITYFMLLINPVLIKKHVNIYYLDNSLCAKFERLHLLDKVLHYLHAHCLLSIYYFLVHW